MKLRTILTFLIAASLCYLSLYGVTDYLKNEQKNEIAKQNFIILETIKNRFKLFLDVPITVGIVGADYFANTDLLTKDYGPLSKHLLSARTELYGLNILDEKGKIIRVFPEGSNKTALGKKSQNFDLVKRSLERNEPFWFSHPFKLFQGFTGFGIYFPLVQNSHVKGWLAIVITSERFERDFKLSEFLESYGLQILDKETNLAYYQTGVLPSSGQVFQTEAKLDGRVITFSCWPKFAYPRVFLPPSWNLILSFIVGSFIVLLLRFYQQKMRARNQLKDISLLLSLTSKEAVSRLIDLQNEMFKIGSAESARYITNLIEQIDLLQTTAYFKRGLDREEIDLLTSLKSQLDELKELIEKKLLRLHFQKEKFTNITIDVNKWLFESSVLSNILTYSILHADLGTQIDIEYRMMNNQHYIIFHTQRIQQLDLEGNQINLDRRMRVSKKVLALYGGNLHVDQDLAGGLTIQIILPM